MEVICSSLRFLEIMAILFWIGFLCQFNSAGVTFLEHSIALHCIVGYNCWETCSHQNISTLWPHLVLLFTWLWFNLIWATMPQLWTTWKTYCPDSQSLLLGFQSCILERCMRESLLLQYLRLQLTYQNSPGDLFATWQTCRSAKNDFKRSRSGNSCNQRRNMALSWIHI